MDIIQDHEEEVYCHPKHIKFKCSIINNKYVEVLLYDNIMVYYIKESSNHTINFCQEPNIISDQDNNDFIYNTTVGCKYGETKDIPYHMCNDRAHDNKDIVYLDKRDKPP